MMEIKRRWSFGLGTIFSLIVVYFIYLYSKDRGWTIPAFLSKWYLIFAGGLIALSIGILIPVMLFFLLMFLIAAINLRRLNKNYKKEKNKSYIDAEFKVKE